MTGYRWASRDDRHAHKCHWPGCELSVAPRFWGCKAHWFKLPKHIRDRIWNEYEHGQEITKRPSAAYIEAAREAHVWAVMVNYGLV